MRIANPKTWFPTYRQAAGGWQIGQNALWLGVGRIGTQILLMGFNILIARRLGDAGLGQYAFMASVIVLGNVITTFGTDMIAIRHIAANRDLSIVPATIVLQLLLCIPVVLILAIIPNSLLSGSVELTHALRIYSLALLPMAIHNPLSALLRGIERMDVLTWLNLSTVLGQVGLALYFIQPDSDLAVVSIVLVVVQGYTVLFAVILCLRIVPELRQRWRSSWAMVWKVFRLSLPLAALGIIGILYQRLTIYQLTLTADLASTGWFAAAARLADAPKLAHYAVMGALFPMMARVDAQREDTKPSFGLPGIALRLLLILSVVAALALCILAQPLIQLLFGPSFTPAVLTLRILAVSLIPFTLSTYFSLRLFTAGYEKRLLGLQLLSVLLLAVMNHVGITYGGAAGGAAAILLIECLQSVLYIVVWRQLSPHPDKEYA